VRCIISRVGSRATPARRRRDGKEQPARGAPRRSTRRLPRCRHDGLRVRTGAWGRALDLVNEFSGAYQPHGREESSDPRRHEGRRPRFIYGGIHAHVQVGRAVRPRNGVSSSEFRRPSRIYASRCGLDAPPSSHVEGDFGPGLGGRTSRPRDRTEGDVTCRRGSVKIEVDDHVTDGVEASSV